MTRAFEEADTRPAAWRLFAVCLQNITDQTLAVYYALPFIAFSQGDYQWILSAMHCESIPEFLFKDFERRSDEDRGCIVAYLAHMYGHRYCSHKLEQIGDCLIHGCAKYPQYFGSLKGHIVRKCWKMLDGETNQAKIVNIGTVCACFYTVPTGRVPCRTRPAIGRVEDANLATYIAGTIDGVADLLCR
jgi:hypothetical protein